jgi:hypothetical protein
MIRYRDGTEIIIGIYWVEGHDLIVAEKKIMLTLDQVFNMYELAKDDLKKKIRFRGDLAG